LNAKGLNNVATLVGETRVETSSFFLNVAEDEETLRGAEPPKSALFSAIYLLFFYCFGMVSSLEPILDAIFKSIVYASESDAPLNGRNLVEDLGRKVEDDVAAVLSVSPDLYYFELLALHISNSEEYSSKLLRVCPKVWDELYFRCAYALLFYQWVPLLAHSAHAQIRKVPIKDHIKEFSVFLKGISRAFWSVPPLISDPQARRISRDPALCSRIQSTTHPPPPSQRFSTFRLAYNNGTSQSRNSTVLPSSCQNTPPSIPQRR
jgi:hypothetical protein